MKLKRHYVRKLDAVGQPVMTEDGRYALESVRDERGQPVLDAEGQPMPKLDHIELEHTGTAPEQNFSVDLVAAGLAEGWISIASGHLTLHVKPENLVYRIRRVPGKHPVPKQHPTDAGYEVIHCYECVLDAQQHARYCAKTERQRREDLYRARGLKPSVKGKGVRRGE